MSEESGIWGKTRKSQKVHFYRGGHTFCGLSHRMDISFPNWDSSEPETCNKCKEWYKWISKGGIVICKPYAIWCDLTKSTQS
jgi:hypothetical protein